MLQTLFGLNGRLTRTGFWEVLVSVLLLDVAAGVAAITAFEQAFHGGPANVASMTYEIVRWGLLAVTALSVWAIAAAHVKRAHDLGHGAVILLWVLLPVLGWLWLLYELGVKPGQNFRNRFGLPPLHDGRQEPAPRMREERGHGWFGVRNDHGGRHDVAMPGPPAELDWTGDASEASVAAAAHYHGGYDAGEALMAASEHHEPEPAPPAAPAEPPHLGHDDSFHQFAPAPPPGEAPHEPPAPDHSGLAAAMGTPTPPTRH